MNMLVGAEDGACGYEFSDQPGSGGCCNFAAPLGINCAVAGLWFTHDRLARQIQQASGRLLNSSRQASIITQSDQVAAIALREPRTCERIPFVAERADASLAILLLFDLDRVKYINDPR